jgi:ribosome-associated heat shock protein Hsp15
VTDADRCRLDVWLWRARFFRSRSLAAGAVEGGGVYLERNGQSRAIAKASASVAVGDGLSFRRGQAVHTIRVLALGVRRGPAAEARALYAEINPALDGSDGADHFDDARKEHDPR